MSQEIVVHCKSTLSGGLTLEVEHGTRVLASTCDRVVWRFEGLPTGVPWAPDVLLTGPLRLPNFHKDATTVEMSGPAVGGAPRALFYQACVHGMVGTFTADERHLAVPSAMPGGPPIATKASLDSVTKKWKLDKEDLVLIGADPAVHWDLSAIAPTSVTFSFTDTKGVTNGTGPFKAITQVPGTYIWIGTGDSEVYSHFTYDITVVSPLLSLSPFSIIIDPGIDNLEPPAGMPHLRSPREGSATARSTAALRPPVANGARGRL